MERILFAVFGLFWSLIAVIVATVWRKIHRDERRFTANHRLERGWIHSYVDGSEVSLTSDLRRATVKIEGLGDQLIPTRSLSNLPFGTEVYVAYMEHVVLGQTFYDARIVDGMRYVPRTLRGTNWVLGTIVAFISAFALFFFWTAFVKSA
ncbi:MAG: hypothetical protein Q4A52_02150 [Bacillota bacterium]|nr:hypothetical protein [Bacillota bacterium]